MTYYKNMELNNPHRKCIILLMNKIMLLVFPHGAGFVEKQNLNYLKTSQKQNHHKFLDVTLFHHLPVLENLMIFGYL